MSIKPTLTLETFPHQQEIIQFFNNHPMKSSLEDPFIEHASGPESVQKVANYFAGKQMHRSEVKSHVVNRVGWTRRELANHGKTECPCGKQIIHACRSRESIYSNPRI